VGRWGLSTLLVGTDQRGKGQPREKIRGGRRREEKGGKGGRKRGKREKITAPTIVSLAEWRATRSSATK
jgi:hypothetical protein